MGKPQSIVEEEDLTQARAAELFGVTQPRVSDLVRGKIELFSIDALVTMLGMRIPFGADHGSGSRPTTDPGDPDRLFGQMLPSEEQGCGLAP